MLQLSENKEYLLKIILKTAIASIILILIGPFSFTVGGIKIVSFYTWVNILVLFALIFLCEKYFKKKSNFPTGILISAFFTILIFFTDWPRRNFSVLEGLVYPESSLIALLCAAVAGSLLIRLLSDKILILMACAVSALSVYLFLSALHFKLIFSDDHPTFLFRLISLKESFPSVPSYNPLWNAGIEFRDFFASGALGLFLLFYPLIKLSDPFETYSLIVAMLLFVFPLIVSYLSCRLLSLGKGVFFLNSVFCLMSSTLWYKWSLSFGTLGFIMASQTLPYLAAFSSKIISAKSTITITQGVLSVLLISLMLLWPISVLFTVPLFIIYLLNFKKLIGNWQVIIILMALLLINIPWMLKFAGVSKVENFIKSEYTVAKNAEPPINEAVVTVKDLKQEFSAQYLYKFLRQNIQTLNPVVLILGIAGLLYMPGANTAVIYISLITWLFFLSTAGSIIKPQLELDRFLITASYLLCLPAAISLKKFNEFTENKKTTALFARTLICFTCFVSLLSLYRIITKKTLTQFTHQQPIVNKLSQAINQYGGEGRVIFAGFTLHELSEGHVAPMVYKTQRPLIARSYKHDHWGHYDVVPQRYLKKNKKRIEEFYNLYNVSAVITSSQAWRDYFQSKNELYKEVWHTERFRIFQRVLNTNSYFYSGNGRIISQSPDNLKLILDSKDAVIKFNYIYGLKSESCKLSGQNIEGAVTLIKLNDCPVNKEIKISF